MFGQGEFVPEWYMAEMQWQAVSRFVEHKAGLDTWALLNRIVALEKRIAELERNAGSAGGSIDGSVK